MHLPCCGSRPSPGEGIPGAWGRGLPDATTMAEQRKLEPLLGLDAGKQGVTPFWSLPVKDWMSLGFPG